MIQFYSPDLRETLQLPETESTHCVKVLRMKQGDNIVVTDGKGYRYDCSIIDAHHKHVYLNINNETQIPNHWKGEITLAIAPTKNLDRMEWLVEKTTEIGIDKITPIRCDHSERKELKTERLIKIAVSAMKQSLKSVLPDIDEMTKFKHVVERTFDGDKFIAYCDKEIERKSIFSEYKPNNNVLILIGPEGDFSPEEVKLALDNGFTPVTLGESRLRTETAGLYAVSAIHTINQIKSIQNK